jgi:hypothetical protein
MVALERGLFYLLWSWGFAIQSVDPVQSRQANVSKTNPIIFGANNVNVI